MIKNDKLKQTSIYIIGLILFAYGLLAINYFVYIGLGSEAFWVCYLALILIGFGAFIGNKTLVESQLIIITAPVLVWLIDFFYRLVFAQSLWGITDYFFTNLLPLSRFISLEHFFILPLGYLLWWLMPGRASWAGLLASSEILLIWVSSYLFTKPEFNVNCVFQSCLSFIPTNSFYSFYSLLIVLVIILVGILIINIIKRLKR